MATRTAPDVGSDGVSATDLLVSKLEPPRRRMDLSRPRLLETCSLAFRKRLAVLDAPPGYGKTTLLADWFTRASATDDRQLAWLTLEATENDPALFWRYVVAALQRGGVDAGARAEHVLLVPGADVEEAVRLLLNDLGGLDPHVVLVLDDYHAVREERCHELMGTFLTHAPPSVHLVVSTRSDPPLPLASLRAAGELAEIRAADLRLTEEESLDFLRLSEDLVLSDEDLALLVARTEGWAAALQLAAVWLHGERDRKAAVREFAGDNRHLVDYLTEHVLAGLEPSVERFLLETSILTRLSAPLCDAVTDETGSATRLNEIERANLLLTPLDGRRRWYRYHPLFAELLRAELARRDPELFPTLHRRAYIWHRDNGTVMESVGHALLAGDHAAAAEAITGAWIPLIRAGGSATVKRWLKRFPREAVADAPQIAYIGAFVTALAGDSEQAIDEWIRLAEANAERAPDDPMPDGTSFEANLEIIRAAFLYRNIGDATAMAERVAKSEAAGGQWRVPSLAALGSLRYFSGDPTGAARAIDPALRDRDAPVRPHGMIHALATSALLELDDREPERAERTARRALDAARSVGLSKNVTAGLAHIALGRSLTAQDRAAEAIDELERGRRLVEGHAPISHHLYALLSLAEAQQASGDMVRANRSLDEAEAEIDQFEDAGVFPALIADLRSRAMLSRRRRPATPGSNLSEAELTVLRLLVGSKSRREIAETLHLSPNTVKTHTSAIYRKLGVGSRVDAVMKARELGLL